MCLGCVIQLHCSSFVYKPVNFTHIQRSLLGDASNIQHVFILATSNYPCAERSSFLNGLI